MRQELDKKIMFVIMIIAIVLFPIYKIITNKNSQIDKKINETKKEQFSMYIEDEDGYKEYTENDKFPEGYYLNIDKSKCEDIEGNKVDASKVLSSKGNSITVRSNKTVYCTLYFDYSETGEKEHPYRIQYIEDLVDLQVSVNNGETYAGKYFELTRDLDFQKNDSYQNYQTKEYGDINGNSIDEELKTELTTGRGWRPIGFYTDNENIERPFNGKLDGKNHRIDHLYIKNDIDTASIGLIGRIENGEISNLTIGGEITTSVTANIGAFAVKVSNLKLDNCHNEVNITSNTGRFQVGGLISIIKGNSEITNCTNKGNITNGNSTSGIVANIGLNATENPIVKIENCENRGTITNSLGSSTTGGIVGITETVPSNITINNCKNYGLITTGKSTAIELKVGGIMGAAGYGSIVTIQNSDNYGEVRSEYNEANPSFLGNGGGILGRVQGNNMGTITKIINSNNHAEVNGMRRGGGLVGQINGEGTLHLDKSYNEGNVTSGPYLNNYDSCGGIVGLINVGKAYVLNTYNKGNVISQSLSASGIVGNFDTTTNIFMAINSYNIGNITNSKDKASGIVNSFFGTGSGRVTLTLNNVYTGGTLNGETGNYGLGSLGTNTNFNGINTVYHLSDYETSNLSITGVTTKSLNEMKSQIFVDLLNTNKNAIDLNSIDSSLKEYSLCNWKMGDSGYPELDC